MKQQTLFGTTFENDVEQKDTLMMHSKNNHCLRKGEIMNLSFGRDDTISFPSSTTTGSTPERDTDTSTKIHDTTSIDNQEEEDDVRFHNESDANEMDDTIEDEIDSWLNYIRSDIKSLAMTVRNTAGGMAHFVHRSAITVVNEIKSLDQFDDTDVDDDDIDDNNGTVDECHINEENENDVAVNERHVNNTVDNVKVVNDSRVSDSDISSISWDMYPFFGLLKSSNKLLLPWEVKIGCDHGTAAFIADTTLQEQILQISHHEGNFMSKKESNSSENGTNDDTNSSTFDIDTTPVHDLIQELFHYDQHLLEVHAKYKFDKPVNDSASTKVTMSDEEKSFWYNYFHACSMVRNRYLSELTLTDKTLTHPSKDDTALSIDDINDVENIDRSGNDEQDSDGEDSYICISKNDHGRRANIPPAPHSSSMKSIDSMVFVEDVSTSLSATTSDSHIPTTVTPTNKNVATNFLKLFA